MKRVVLLLTSLAILASLGGCWDYRGLDELTIVAGLAIDRDQENPEQYHVTFEVIDTQSSSGGEAAKSRLVNSYGKTLFEAVFNAGRQLYTEMYFGNTEILVISEQLAQEEGIATIFESIMRDFDTRETIMILISRTEMARDIITPSEGSNEIIAYNISKTLGDPHLGINTTKAYSVAHGYDILKDDSAQMTHAAMNIMEDEQGNRIPTTDGIALFYGDQLIGFLEQDYIEPYLLTIENVNDGIISFPVSAPEFTQPTRISLNVTNKEGALKCEMVDGKPHMWIELQIWGHAVELSPYLKELNEDVMQSVTRLTEQAVEDQLIDMFQFVQAEYGVEVFGFANALQRAQPDVWEEVKDQWNTLFLQGTFDAQCKVVVRNAGQIQKF